MRLFFRRSAGDLVVLFSDGVSDHLSVAGEEYGAAVLPALSSAVATCTPKQIVDEVFADLDRFNTERFDDQTLIVMRVKPK